MTSGILIIISSALMLILGIACIIKFDKLNNHTPFHEVEYLEYLANGLCACLLTPAAIFGIVAGAMILISNKGG